MPAEVCQSVDPVFAYRAVVYIDGAKGYNPHMLNLVDMRNMSTPGVALLQCAIHTGLNFDSVA